MTDQKNGVPSGLGATVGIISAGITRAKNQKAIGFRALAVWRATHNGGLRWKKRRHASFY
jgi:hypothetical protein